MSDNEDVNMCEDDEDYGLEFSDDSISEVDAELENQYYNSKLIKKKDLNDSLESFQKVLYLEAGEKGEWGFKALKQMTKINFLLTNFDEMINRYKQLLTYMKTAVTRNHSEKSINSILDLISTSKNMDLLQNIYETTLDGLKDANNHRLWFKTNTKLGQLYLHLADYNKLSKILMQLYASCKTDNCEDDHKKGTQKIEICALGIQMLTAQKNNSKLKELYEQSLHIKYAIPHPLTMGVIRECGGKMYLDEGNFSKAHSDFFEAFKNYDKSGSPRRITCLKYLVLANMLTKSGINPFHSQEAKPYKNDPEILAMTNLVEAYQNDNIKEFEIILKNHRQNIMNDSFLREHIEVLLRNIRTQVLIKLIKPYTRVHISYIAMELNIEESDVENLLVSCILDETIKGRIDQINQVLILTTVDSTTNHFEAINRWTDKLASLNESILQQM